MKLRALDEVFIKDLQVGKLKDFLERVKKDDTLCLWNVWKSEITISISIIAEVAYSRYHP